MQENTMKNSRIFSKSEITEIERRKDGDYSDKYGLFSSRIRPKINEILEVWIPKKKELKRLIEPKRKKKDSRG